MITKFEAMTLRDFEGFKGKEIRYAADAIDAIAAKHKLAVAILDEGLPGNIDVDMARLNVTVDKNQRVKSFSIG